MVDGPALFEIAETPPLIGIAKLAAQSTTLEAKSRVEYREIEARSVLNRTKPGMPFTWTINPYRGCEFGCKYCYARYAHEFMGFEDPMAFETTIYAKTDGAWTLRQELRKTAASDAIAIGTATDPYQPAERRFRRTRSILEVFATERDRSVSITTKSDLVSRDIDLLLAIQRENTISVNITITTLDASLARLMEPRAPRPDLRLKTVSKLAAAGIPVGVFPNPILPLITDQERKLDRLAKAARDAGATYFGGGALFLMPVAQKVFFPFLEERFPHLLQKYRERFAESAYLRGPYMETLRERIRTIRDRYGLDASPPKHREALAEPTLFPLN